MRKNDADVFALGATPRFHASPAQVIERLSPLVTPERLARIRGVAARRSYGVVPVLEHLTDPFNASAIMRSADAFGVQRVEVIPERDEFLMAGQVSRGAHRWLELRRHADAERCAERLHAEGYEIFVATMEGALRPEELAEREKVAIVFGNEHAGVSGGLRDAADGTYAVPMRGFVESLNVSVAAAVTLYQATRGREGQITDEEREQVVAHCLRATVANSDALLAEAFGHADAGNASRAVGGL